MRIWHQSLIPLLCRQHLLAVWREGLGAYKIITEGKQAYRHHPAVKEFENCEYELWWRLKIVREEMLKRGWNPKQLPEQNITSGKAYAVYKPWQTLEQQVEILKAKGCDCNV